MSIYEYNDEEHIRRERESSREEGFTEGREKGRAEGHEIMARLFRRQICEELHIE